MDRVIKPNECFDVAEVRLVHGARLDGGDQVFLRLGSGEDAGGNPGWTYCFARNSGALLAEVFTEAAWVPTAQEAGCHSLAAGWAHAVRVHNGGVLTLGRGKYGRLGLGHEEHTRFASPVQLLGLHDKVRVKAVAAGYAHSMVLTELTGQLFTMGHGSHGQLGHGTRMAQLHPRRVETVLRPKHAGSRGDQSQYDEMDLSGCIIVQMAAGRTHSLAVTQAGELLSFGSNYHGQCGTDVGGTLPSDDELTPKAVLALRSHRVVLCAAGGEHSVCVTETGECWSFGAGANGALGNEHEQKFGAATAAFADEFTYDQAKPTPIKFIRHLLPVVSITTGYKHTIFISNASGVLCVYAFGCGKDGRLGHGDTEDRQTPQKVEALAGASPAGISAGDRHSLVLDADGTTFSFGCGSSGQLGHGDRKPRLLPTAVEALRGKRMGEVAAGEAHSFVNAASGTLYVLGHFEHAVFGASVGWPKHEGTEHLLPREVAQSSAEVESEKTAAAQEAARVQKTREGYDHHALDWWWPGVMCSDGSKPDGRKHDHVSPCVAKKLDGKFARDQDQDRAGTGTPVAEGSAVITYV
jgi:alpha-tubulin suppressor-like RCC1 family protein